MPVSVNPVYSTCPLLLVAYSFPHHQQGVQEVHHNELQDLSSAYQEDLGLLTRARLIPPTAATVRATAAAVTATASAAAVAATAATNLGGVQKARVVEEQLLMEGTTVAVVEVAAVTATVEEVAVIAMQASRRKAVEAAAEAATVREVTGTALQASGGKAVKAATAAALEAAATATAETVTALQATVMEATVVLV